MHIIKRTATVEKAFVGEGYFDLRLRIGELEDLQDITGFGPATVLSHLVEGSWRVAEIRETLRLALIGGGLPKQEAFDLINRNVKEGHLLDYLLIAATALRAALLGPEEDEATVGEPQAGLETVPPIPAEESDGPMSTGSAAPPVSRRRKSAK